MVPHITDAIKNWIESVAVIPVDGKDGPADVCVIELGGTVGKNYIETYDASIILDKFLINTNFLLGDIESMPFIEALRQLSFSVGKVAHMML